MLTRKRFSIPTSFRQAALRLSVNVDSVLDRPFRPEQAACVPAVAPAMVTASTGVANARPSIRRTRKIRRPDAVRTESEVSEPQHAYAGSVTIRTVSLVPVPLR